LARDLSIPADTLEQFIAGRVTLLPDALKL
jgi:hypothetical protein